MEHERVGFVFICTTFFGAAVGSLIVPAKFLSLDQKLGCCDGVLDDNGLFYFFFDDDGSLGEYSLCFLLSDVGTRFRIAHF